jgi:hypothetical protein
MPRDPAIPRRDAPEACDIFRPIEGVGNAGCPMHPQPLCIGSKHRVVTTVASEITRHSRTRMVLTAYSALSPATNSFCHRHRRIEGFIRPGWADEILRRFSTSNGCQDHTALPCATRLRQEASVACARPPKLLVKPEAAPFVLRAPIAHGKPSCDHPARPTLPRPPHPTPTFVTMANAPR